MSTICRSAMPMSAPPPPGCWVSLRSRTTSQHKKRAAETDGLSRRGFPPPSTSCDKEGRRTWMPATRAGMTTTLHPEIEHAGDLRQRQRGGADDGAAQPHQGAVAAATAAHLASDPFQHLGIDAD